MSSESNLEPFDASTRSAVVKPPFDESGSTRTKSAPVPDAPLDVTPTPFVPDLERYRFIKSLGRGGMGHVWLAYDKKLKREVAIKFMLKAAEESPIARARFESESAVLAQLKHDHVIKVFDAGEAKGQLYFSMEYLADKSLHERREEFRADAKSVVEVLCGVLLGLDHAHERGIFHRDIKPANVLLRGRVPVLSDFGVAKWTEADMTMTYAVLGTASHMAPEVARSGAKDYHARSDVFAAGVMLYTLLTDELPFPVVLPPNSLIKLPDHSADPKPVRERPKVIPGVDEQLERVVRKALAREPEFRYQSAAEMRDELTKWQAGQPVTAPKKTPRKRKVWPWIAATVAVLLTIGVTLAVVMHKKQEPVDATPAPLMTEEEVINRVAAGEEVILIAEGGGTRIGWRPVGLTAADQLRSDESGVMVETDGVAVYDLLRYDFPYPVILRATVVHRTGDPSKSRIGLYCRRREHLSAFGPGQLLYLNHLSAPATSRADGMAWCQWAWVKQSGSSEGCNPLTSCDEKGAHAGRGPGGHDITHTLELVIEPTRHQGRLDGDPYTPDELTSGVKYALNNLKSNYKFTPPLPAFGSGTGVIVAHGSATVRGMTLEKAR